MTISASRPVELTGRIVAQHRGRYVVRINQTLTGELRPEVRSAEGRSGSVERDAVVGGRLLHEALGAVEFPAVGDYVALGGDATDDGTLRIEKVLPRRSALVRRAAGESNEPQVLAANIDVALIASALPHDLNLRRLERYLTLAWESGATPLVVLTKADLVVDVDAAVAEASGVAVGADIVAISTRTGMGVDELAGRVAPGMTAVLLGSSGVGKSTLVNALLGAQRQRTSAVREDGAGRHTTTHRELIELPNGAFLIDTPGLREVGLWTADAGLEQSFGDVEALAADCRFADCAHETEPDCAVLAAVGTGLLDSARLESWRSLRRELAFLERKIDVAAAEQAKRHAKSLEKLGRARLKEKYE